MMSMLQNSGLISVALVYGLNLVGIHGKNTFVDRTLIFVMAEGMMSLSTFGLKKVTHRLRPDGPIIILCRRAIRPMPFLGPSLWRRSWAINLLITA